MDVVRVGHRPVSAAANITHGNTFCREDHVCGNYCVDNYGSESLFRGESSKIRITSTVFTMLHFSGF